MTICNAIITMEDGSKYECNKKNECNRVVKYRELEAKKDVNGLPYPKNIKYTNVDSCNSNGFIGFESIE